MKTVNLKSSDADVHIEVSVVIPAYNAAGALPDQLSALARQQFPSSWEIVLVDNLSRDRTREVAEEFRSILPLRIVDATEQQGAAHARNVGVREARGTYVAFCDADDVVADDWLIELMAFSSVDTLVAGTIDSDNGLNSDVVRRARYAGRVEIPMGPASLGPVAWGSNMLAPKELLTRVGLFDESLGAGEDAELCYRAMDVGAKLASASRAVINYRLRESALSGYRQAKLWAYWDLWFYRRYRERGATKRSTKSMVYSLWWILTRAPFIFRNEVLRLRWFSKIGTIVGHTRGSFAHRAARGLPDAPTS